jgi:cell division protein FtsZ
MLDLEPVNDAKILVIGCGGAGGNAVNTMIESGEVEFVDFAAINTDSQALSRSKASVRIQIGERTRKGLGCGAKPECGKAAAEDDQDKIKNVLEEHDMVFITAGFGGGTGTGSASVVAKLARELGILTVAVVSKPFNFEGRRKLAISELWLDELKENVDSLIVISNQKIVETAGSVTFLEAFKLADNVLKSSVMGISEAIMRDGLVNIDFADVKTTLFESGEALIGLGFGSGDNKVLDAVKVAINNPLVEGLSIEGAGSVLINYTIGYDTSLDEVDAATNFIVEKTSADVNVIFGVILDPNLENGVQVTVVATKFNDLTSEVEIIEESKEIKIPEHLSKETKIVEDTVTTIVTEKNIVLEAAKNTNSGYGPTNVVKKTSARKRPIKVRNKEDLDIPTFLR